MAAPPPPPGPCFDAYAPVCGAEGGKKFTYTNACLTAKDGAAVASKGACPKVVKHKKHKKQEAQEEGGQAGEEDRNEEIGRAGDENGRKE
jgi:hypothetical protein